MGPLKEPSFVNLSFENYYSGVFSTGSTGSAKPVNFKSEFLFLSFAAKMLDIMVMWALQNAFKKLQVVKSMNLSIRLQRITQNLLV